MRKKILILILLSLFQLSVAILTAQTDTSSQEFENFGYSLYNDGKYLEAVNMLNKCIQTEREQENPDLDQISNCMNSIGVCYYNMKQCEEAISYLEQALEIDKQQENHERIATRICNIGSMYETIGIYDRALEYYLNALAMDIQSGDSSAIAKSLNNIGYLYDSWSKYDKAIEYYEQSLKIFDVLGDTINVAKTLSNIGLVYNSWGNYENALENFEEALRIAIESEDEEEVATRLNNIGLVYHNMEQYDKAIEYYNEVLNTEIRLNDIEGIARSYNNIGVVYKDIKEYDKATNYLELALIKYRELNLDPEISTVLSNIGDIYSLSGDYDKAYEFLSESLEMTLKLDNGNQTITNYHRLSQLYTAKGDYKSSLEYYKKYNDLKDTVFSAEKHKQIANFEIKYKTERKDKEIRIMKQNEIIQGLDLKKQKILRNSFIYGFVSVLVLALIIFYGLVQKRRATKIIAAEKEKSDELLLNILPSGVASDLKEKGSTEPEMFENVTVFFSDIIGFTERSSELEPQVIISELNDVFTGFDNIIEKNHGERIKTIGDAYLAVCGLPESNPRHADNIVNAALEIVEYITKRNDNSKHKWEIRVGIHSGSVVGGVVGIKKYIYDVFGDTINTASRMEVNSAPMRVNISQTTFELVKYRFNVEDRGDIETKGKGRIKMYFVKGLKDNLKI